MVNFRNIEDMSAIPTRVWLSREKESDVWQPLRKADSKSLNKNPDKPSLIEGGRGTADPEFGVIRYNFYSRIQQSLTSSTWFVKDDRDSKNPILIPMSQKDGVVVEEVYQKAVYEASSSSKGLESIMKEEAALESGEFNVMVQKHDANTCVLRKCPLGWGLGRSYDLQRGYGLYTVEGEEEEETLGPIRHLLFVIHGVGEAMWTRDDVSMSSLTDELNNVRLVMQRQQIAEWKKECEAAKKQKRPEPDPPSRVELIPILWYDQIHSSSNSLTRSIKATTLTTIPALRNIANDVVLDVLTYLTPNFCYDTLECVTDQIIEIFQIFKKINPDFASNGGKCSLVGHSLGSVICWDLLSILKESTKTDDHGVHITHDGNSADVVYQQYASGENANKAKSGSWGPTLPKPMARCLPFVPDFTMFLGSPLGLMLSLRGAHAVFDELRETEGDGKSRSSPFTLPSGSIHNIFHPSDPVAYRIEPLLLAQGTEDLPHPLYLTREGKGVRLHVKAMQMGGEIRKSMAEKSQSITSFMSGLTAQAQVLLHQLDERNEEVNKEKDSETGPIRFYLAGRNDRLDLQLQPRVIDNEYLSAVMAHSSYFANTDVIDYVIDLTRVKKKEVIDLTSNDNMDLDDTKKAEEKEEGLLVGWK